MAAKSKTISSVLLFFVFIVLATDRVHGNAAYDICMAICEVIEDSVAAWACRVECELIDGSNINFETDEHAGRVGIVQNSAEKPKLLITTDPPVNDHGFTILEVNPNTLMAPAGHWDADALFIVVQGKATINLIRQDKRETLGVKTGDIIRIPSGTKVLMINKDSMEKLVVIKFPQLVSIPAGHSKVKLLDPFKESSQKIAEEN